MDRARKFFKGIDLFVESYHRLSVWRHCLFYSVLLVMGVTLSEMFEPTLEFQAGIVP